MRVPCYKKYDTYLVVDKIVIEVINDIVIIMYSGVAKGDLGVQPPLPKNKKDIIEFVIIIYVI